MGHRLHQAPFTLSADCALCLRSAGAPAMVIDEGWGAGVCVCVRVHNYVCMKMSVGKHLSVWLFVPLISSLYLCVSVQVCVCTLISQDVDSIAICLLFFFFFFPSNGQVSHVAAHLTRSLLVASVKASQEWVAGGGRGWNKAFLIGNGTSRQIKWLGVWDAVPHGDSILCV